MKLSYFFMKSSAFYLSFPVPATRRKERRSVLSCHVFEMSNGSCFIAAGDRFSILSHFVVKQGTAKKCARLKMQNHQERAGILFK